jgi:hypothetical protein
MRNDVLRARVLVIGFVVGLAACGGTSDVLIGSQPSDGGGEADVGGGGQADGAGGQDAGGGHDGSAGADGPGMDAPASDGPGSTESGGGDGSTFDPGSVSGLVLWLEADKGVTQSANAVSAWADQTSNHNDASQPTAAEQPTLTAAAIGGMPALHFAKGAGTTTPGDMLSIADASSLQWGTGDFYVVVVANFDNTLADGAEEGVGALFDKASNASNFPGPFLTANIIGAITTSQTGLGFSTSVASGDWVLTNTPYNNSTSHAFAMQRVGLTLDLRVDGASVGTSTSDGIDVSTPGTPVSIGGTTNGQGIRLDGDIAEILAVKGTLAASNRTGIESYVRTKYAL